MRHTDTDSDIAGNNQQAKPTSLIELIRFRQAEIGLTDQQLGEALGYNRVVIVTMFKQGAMRLPLTKIPALANALAVDPTDLMRLALVESLPDLLPVVEQASGALRLTTTEINLVRHLRMIAGEQPIESILVNGRPITAAGPPGMSLPPQPGVRQGH